MTLDKKNKQSAKTTGFSNRRLTSLSSRPFWEKGFAPWMAWESERTGFGLGIRVGGLLPVFLPLPLASDHYADPITSVRENEVRNEWGLYLTWSERKVELMRALGLNAICVKHPWRYLGLGRIKRKGSGTLVFLPHSHDNLKSEFRWESIRTQLNSIDEKYYPLTVCIGEQDIKNNLHHIVRHELKLPIVTAGDLNSQLFPFRFWRLLARYRYTVGFNLASHTMYCIWAGRPFRLMGDGSFKYSAVADDGSLSALSELTKERIRVDNPDVQTFDKVSAFYDSLGEDLETPSIFQYRFVDEFTNSSEAITRLQLVKLLWSQVWKTKGIVIPRAFQEIASRLKFRQTDDH